MDNDMVRVRIVRSFKYPEWAAGEKDEVKEYTRAYAEYLIENGYAEMEQGNEGERITRKAAKRADDPD